MTMKSLGGQNWVIPEQPFPDLFFEFKKKHQLIFGWLLHI